MTQLAAIEATRARLQPLVALALDLAKANATDAASDPNPNRPKVDALVATAVKASLDLAAACLAIRASDLAALILADIRLLADRNPDWHGGNANVAEQMGDIAAMAHHIDQAIHFGDANGDLLVQLGRAWLAKNEPAKARAAFGRALTIDPECYAALVELSHFSLLTGAFDEAKRQIAHALKIRPGGHLALIYRAQLAMGEGRMDDARQDLETILTGNPDNIDAHVLMARLKTFAKDDPAIDTMRQLWTSGIKDTRQTSRLGFALFKALDDIGAADEAFDVLLVANRLRKIELGQHDVVHDERLMGDLAAEFSIDRVTSLGAHRTTSPIPVFIVGLPRSGTSLMEQILASHSDVHGAGERDTISQIVKTIAFEPGSRSLRPLDDSLTPESLAQMAAIYERDVLAAAHDKAVVTDKMPVNALWIGFILMIFPTARIIHMMRDRLANAFAIFASNFEGRGMPWIYDLDQIGRYLLAQEKLMAHWRGLFPDAILDVGYEALTADPEREIRRVLAHCDLEFDPACLRFYDSKRPVLTMSATQVVKPIYDGRDRRTQKYARHLSALTRQLEGAHP